MLDAAQRATGLTQGKARALLGRFLFSGEEAEKPLAGLSGGERRRLSLAILVHSGANVLILDEPTNHLDIESREALEDALRAFTGAVLLVSHDRALLDAVGTRTVAVEEGSLHSYLGGWPEYVRIREEIRSNPETRRGQGQFARIAAAAVARDGRSSNGTDPENDKPKQKPKPKGPSKNRLSDQQKAERAIEAGRGGDGGARAGAGRPGGVGEQVRVGQVRSAPHGSQAGGRAGLRAPGVADRLSASPGARRAPSWASRRRLEAWS